MNHLKTILSILTVVLISSASHAKLVINELMQSNIDCIMDDLNDFPDSWVELYNNGTTTEKLKNYKLNITNDRNNAWTLPDIEVAAGGHVVVYCDKVGKGLHTNFRISSDDDCELWLYNEAGLSDVVKVHKKQPAPNISYGRATDGTSKWGYQATPTPGTANCGEVCDRLLGEPIFSQEGCVMDPTSSVRITLSLPEGTPEDAEIRYTIDGKEPTTSSHKYVSPILFTTNRVIRAKIFCKGYLSPRSTAHSYIFFPRTRALTLPVISIITDNKYMTDSKIGIYVDGSYQSSKKNYQFNWRRPINIEMFEGKDQPSVINQLCETRVMGGATRNMALKSLAVYANKRFGKKRFNYEFFPDLRPGYK
ncbi:MAG: chitobiase/beta-hexosaminidase C-terminal domain-containing protein [Bacteroidaceae bacterium]|nr:chitobiase/beta-hexosaminidase C-terminal domain-containing protein [Bacteroidaceae bacterium]